MSSVDILRSFAESREHDAVMIRGGINYGNVRDVLRRVAELEAALAAERERLEAKKLEVDAAMDCYKAALNAMRKDWREMFESTQAAGVELADERKRREAAEAALGEVVDCNNSDPILISREPDYRWYDVIARATAHFARYKD